MPSRVVCTFSSLAAYRDFTRINTSCSVKTQQWQVSLVGTGKCARSLFHVTHS